MAPRSGVVIVIPEAEARFGALRRRFDPQARLGLPAHVTILFPFMPPALVHAPVLRRLELLFQRCSPFHCVFARVERFPSTAWLAPSHAAPFVDLTNAVAREFPQYPPYGGVHATVVPHLTIADGDAGAADSAERELRADLERHGPVSGHCDSVQLLENASGRWRQMHEFPLAGRQG
jgi:2'-5' RNA ligase